MHFHLRVAFPVSIILVQSYEGSSRLSSSLSSIWRGFASSEPTPLYQDDQQFFFDPCNSTSTMTSSLNASGGDVTKSELNDWPLGQSFSILLRSQRLPKHNLHIDILPLLVINSVVKLSNHSPPGKFNNLFHLLNP